MKKIILIVVMLLLTTSSYADIFEGAKKIYLLSAANELTHFANVTFTPEDNRIAYQVTLIDTPFENQFLSMRPFQCVMGKKQVMCHVPYPYEKTGYITQEDLTELSYDLLFLHKNPAEYGINLWNGIFYKLSIEGETVKGTVHEVDMNVIASPPETDELPFTDDQIFEADVENYVYPNILIK